MELNWMGRYRPLIETLVRHRNLYARAMNIKSEDHDGISLSLLEWEVLEYIIEHEEDDSSMIRIAERLAIAQSSFSKFTRTLCGYGLVAKYQMVGNRKNIILRATDLGREYYAQRVKILSTTIFGEFFKDLEPLSDEDLERVIRAITRINPKMGEPGQDTPNRELIKLD